MPARRIATTVVLFLMLAVGRTNAGELHDESRRAESASASFGNAIVAQATTEAATESSSGGGLKFAIRSYRAEGNTLLEAADIERSLRLFVGPHRDFGDVQQALETLQRMYQDRGYAGILVTLPEQELERGHVVFRVTEPKIRQVLVEGNEHFSADNARRSVPSLVPGASPMAREIAASIKLINESPAKQGVVLLRPATRNGEVDAVIRMADVYPARYSVSFDNTGNKETGAYRTAFAY